MADSDIFWILLLMELGVIITSDGIARLLAAGATVGTVYLGSQKNLV
jgi:hypothetical protein